MYQNLSPNCHVKIKARMKRYPIALLCKQTKAVGTVLELGGGGQIFFLYITLTYKRDTIFFINISVISKFTELSVYFILIYIHYLYLTIFKLLILLVGKILGGALPPPCPPLFLRPCKLARLLPDPRASQQPSITISCIICFSFKSSGALSLPA